MPMSFNRVHLIGNLTHDPELRSLASGGVVLHAGIAVHHTWRDKSGQRQEETNFFDIEAWGRTAELMGQYLGKGSPCLIEGRLKQNIWTDREGRRRQRVVVICDSVQFLGPRRQAEGDQTVRRNGEDLTPYDAGTPGDGALTLAGIEDQPYAYRPEDDGDPPF